MTAMKDRLQLAGTQVREQRAEMKADRAERRNRRLMEQTDLLRAELDREREGREELLGLIKGGKVGRRRGGVIRVIAVGGVAYLLGAKAGRARYEQIMAWIRQMRDQARRRGSEIAEETTTALETTSTKAATTPKGARSMSEVGA